GKRRIVCGKICVERVGGLDGVVQQISLPGRVEVGGGHLEPAVPSAWCLLQLLNARVDQRLEMRIGVRLERENGCLENVAAEITLELAELLHFERNGHVRIDRDLGLPEVVRDRYV